MLSESEVRIKSDAPTSSTTARLTSTSTSTERVLFWRKPLPERLLESLMTVFKSVREATSAGINPNKIPVTIDNPIVNTTMRQSMPSSEPALPQPRQAGRVDRQQPSHPGVAGQEAERPADKRQHQALGQELRA